MVHGRGANSSHCFDRDRAPSDKMLRSARKLTESSYYTDLEVVMKKKSTKKLRLHRETLRALEAESLEQAAGGASLQSNCRTICICPTLSVGNCLTKQWTACPLC